MGTGGSVGALRRAGTCMLALVLVAAAAVWAAPEQSGAFTAADTLFGAVDPPGTLPVTITRPPPSTTVVYPFGFGLHYR